MTADQLRRIALSVLTLFALVGQNPARAVQQFTVRDIGTLQSDTGSQARAINDLGHVVGESVGSGSTRAFVWAGANGIQPLALPTGMAAGTPAVASGINASGKISGIAGFRGVLWDGSVVTDLTTLPGGTNYVAFGINDSGTVVGSRYVTGETAAFASGGTVSPLSVLNASDSFSRALAINNRGEIVGQSGVSAVIWTSQVPTELAESASARAINDTNGIAGVQTASIPNSPGQSFQAVLWLSGVMSILENPSSFSGSVANGINDANIVVGHGGSAGFHPVLDQAFHRALLWEAGVGYDLNSLVVNGSGWALLEAWDINNRGEVVGLGFREGQGLRAFILTPVPEPAAVWSMLCGLGVLFVAFRNRVSRYRQPEQ